MEIVLSGTTDEPRHRCSMSLIQRDENDTPTLIWQGEIPSNKFPEAINMLERLPKGFGPTSYLFDHFTRISKL